MFPLIAALTLSAAISAGSQPDSARFSPEEQRIIREIGGTITTEGMLQLGGITLHPDTRELSFAGRTQITSGIIEVLIATPKGRAHEAPVEANINPFHLQVLCYLAGSHNGTRKKGSGKRQGDCFRIEVQPQGGGRRPIEDWIQQVDRPSHEPIRDWVFVGSGFSGQECLAEREGNVVLLWSNGQSVFDNPYPDGDVDDNFVAFTENFPPKAVDGENVPVTIFLIPTEQTRSERVDSKKEKSQ